MKPTRKSPPVNNSLRAAFVADVQKCEKLLAQFDAFVESHERDEQALAALRNECAALDSTVDANDAAAVSVLCAKERQVQLLATRVSSVDERLDPLALELKAALLRSADTLREFLKPAHTALVEEVSSALKPHFRDAGRAEQIAGETDSVRSLVRILTAYWISDASFAPINCARQVVPELRAILDGKQPWRMA